MKANARHWMVAASLLVLMTAGTALAQNTTAVEGGGGTAGTAAQPPAPDQPLDPVQVQADSPATDPAQTTTDSSNAMGGPTALAGSAQTAGDAECYAATSEITDLREPQFGTGSVFDLAYAQDGMDVFSDVLPLGGDMYIAGGAYTKDQKDAIYRPLLVKYDERLKPVWEVREDTPHMRTIHRMIATKDGITVLGDIGDAQKRSGIYIASYDFEGKVRGKPVPIFESGGDLDAKAFVQARDGSGYLIAAQFIADQNEDDQYGVLYKVSRSGVVSWKRSFKTGRSTVFNTITAAIDGTSYVLAGQIVMEGNTSGGWLLVVDGNGAIKWQRTYPRGLAATLQAAAQTKDGDFIVSGKARPANYTGQGLAAWVMKTDMTGSPLWQRFFRGAYSYDASDLIVYEDGRASVLVAGAAQDSERRSHVRLMTFSPQGTLQHLEEFTEGQNAAAHRLVAGTGGERLIAGYAQTTFGEGQESNEAAAAPVYTYDAWLVAGVPLDSYDDPCAPPSKLSPILN